MILSTLSVSFDIIILGLRIIFLSWVGEAFFKVIVDLMVKTFDFFLS